MGPAILLVNAGPIGSGYLHLSSDQQPFSAIAADRIANSLSDAAGARFPHAKAERCGAASAHIRAASWET